MLIKQASGFFRFHQSYIGNQKWLEESVHEAEVRTYYVRYPTLQRLASRNLKLSPFHSRLEEAGAFFGATGGHERPLFFLTGWCQKAAKMGIFFYFKKVSYCQKDHIF